MRSTIVKWGNSQGIRLPKQLLDSVRLTDRDIVEITAENDSIVIRKSKEKKPYKTIQERFQGFQGEYEPIVIDLGKPAGKEVW